MVLNERFLGESECVNAYLCFKIIFKIIFVL